MEALTVRFEDVSAGWEKWIMLSSDRHHDAPACDREKEIEHLEKAKARDALIVDAGDIFDAMQGKYDPRKSMDGIREEDAGEDYIDRIVKHAARDYGPYAEQFLVMGYGNHETKIRKHNGVDLIENLTYRLNNEYGGDIKVGGYGGWVRFVFKISTVGQSCNLKYFHGKSTSAPVTKGVIQTNRQATRLPDADVVLNGHNHESYLVSIPRERLSIHGNISTDKLDFVRTPGYKDVWKHNQGKLGYEAEHGNPKLTGCAWLRFYYDSGGVKRELTLDTGE